MTIRITKLRLGALILAFALFVPATAWATHVFTDVTDGAFYAQSAEWAKTNNITKGTNPSGTLFSPNRTITRGEAVTFLKRYNDNVVQPSFASLPTVLWANVASNGSKVSGNLNITTSRSGAGAYTVNFSRDITGCSWSGISRIGVGLQPVNAGDTVVGLSQKWHMGSGGVFNLVTDPNQINVTTYTGNVQQDASFNIQVTCNLFVNP